MARFTQLLVSFAWVATISSFLARRSNCQDTPLPTDEIEIAKSVFTVADAIDMTDFGNPYYLGGFRLSHNVAQFSPDGEHFAIVIKKGNLQKNTNDYSLLLFRARDAFESPAPIVLASFASSSDRPGIQDSKWIDDTSIAFLAENPGEMRQLYIVNCETGRLEKVTNHTGNLVSFVLTHNNDRLFFTAEPEPERLVSAGIQHDGVVVSHQLLTDLILGENQFKSTFYQVLYSMRRGASQPERIETHGIISHQAICQQPICLSPDGRYLIYKTTIDKIPDGWKDYQDDALQKEIRAKRSDDLPYLIYRYELVDTASGLSKPLVDAPLSKGNTELAWSRDSRSVVVSGTFLPLNAADPSERKARQSRSFVVEVRIPSQEIVTISSRELKLLRWDARTDRVLFESTVRNGTADIAGEHFVFQRTAGGWHEVPILGSDVSFNPKIDVTLEENMNSPPRIFVTDVHSGRKGLLLDLNPGFKKLKFGSVREISFKATDGHVSKAGLILPPDYVVGSKYPLVIQTHGWNPERFWVNGPYPIAFAAQPLAGAGFVVVQLEEDSSQLGTTAEVQRETAAYEGVIDYLDSLRLIDRDRIGLIGFSRTGLHVEYALTHSKYRFAAATLADIADGGYFRYVALLNFLPGFAADSEGINGGPPFGNGLLAWLRNSPDFNLDRVAAPVWMEANGPLSLLFEWEWFAGLSKLGKPVELLYLPNAGHVLVKPWDRRISQQGTVDWFGFWLLGKEDADPTKAEQYSRWRKMRNSGNGRN